MSSPLMSLIKTYDVKWWSNGIAFYKKNSHSLSTAYCIFPSKHHQTSLTSLPLCEFIEIVFKQKRKTFNFVEQKSFKGKQPYLYYIL